MLVFIWVARIPFLHLLTEPVVFSFFSLWASFAWSVLYISLAAVPLVYTTTHNFSLATSNAFFAATNPPLLRPRRLRAAAGRLVPLRLDGAAVGALDLAGIFAVYLAVFNYLPNTYGRFASSALAAQGFCRNGLGGVLAPVAGRMFEALGYGGAGSVLGAVAVALTGVPWVLVLYRERIRARSKFASAF
ncbi:MFS transporter [Neofusicoccum parvum]|uniref:MFS transporter n=1 Tax=Neofusicoccum parvum TaxID=310453 RepID=A0ACB5SFF8_9PEZI|nr:MFS transporter [Neofusicoccum parvum]